MTWRITRRLAVWQKRFRGLLRFSAVVRAVDVWFGLGWDAVSTGVIKGTLERVLRFLEDPGAREEAPAGSG